MTPSPDTCALLQTSEADLCLSYYEHQCAGICNSEKRLGPIYRSCLQDPLRTGANPGSIPRIDEGSANKDPALELKDAKELKKLQDAKELKDSQDPKDPQTLRRPRPLPIPRTPRRAADLAALGHLYQHRARLVDFGGLGGGRSGLAGSEFCQLTESL